jgi:anti-sigma28 factor (negative regulator of flagellin synthesis)
MFQAGDFNTTETVVIPLNSFTSDDPSASVTVTNLAAADIEIHKDGGATQRASDNGVTVNIDFDTVTGNHTVEIDLSDNSDAGFYAAGSRYLVRMEGVTIDGATINAWIGGFSIGCVLRPTTDGRTLDVAATGEAGLDFGNVVGTLTGGELGVGVFAAGAITAAAIATGAVDADALSTDGVNEIRDAITGGAYALDTDANGRVRVVDGTGAGEIDTASGRVQITTAQEDAIVDKVWDELQSAHTTGGSFGEIATEIAAILVDTAEIGTAGAGLTNVPWNASWDAEVQSEVNDGLVALGLDHLVSASVIGTDITDNSIIARMVSKSATADWDSFNNTTDSLEAVADSNSAIETDTQDIQSRLPAALVSGRMDSSVGAMAANTLTASALATDAVNEVRDAITGGAYALDTDANGRIRIVDGTGAGELDTSSGTVTVGTNNDKTGYSISGTKTTLDALNDLSAAQVNAEVVDVITVDTIPELAQAKPAATPTLASGLMLLYMALRNKIDQTNSLFEIHNNAGTQIATKAVSDDGSTYTEAQMAAGT